MSTTLVVQEKRSAALAPTDDPVDPLMALMNRFAANDSLSPEKAKALMDLYIDGQRKMQEMQDERAFADAMAEFKKNPPKIVKNRTAKMQGTAKASGREYNYEYSYADLDAYCSEAMPMLAERGITWSFPFVEQNGEITVSCILRYGLYKHTPTTLSGKPEGGNNALQAKGVAVAYLERYTFAGATGLTAAMPDSDGRTTPAQAEVISEQQQATLQEWADALRQAPDKPSLQSTANDAIKYAKSVSPKAGSRMIATFNECLARFK